MQRVTWKKPHMNMAMKTFEVPLLKQCNIAIFSIFNRENSNTNLMLQRIKQKTFRANKNLKKYFFHFFNLYQKKANLNNIPFLSLFHFDIHWRELFTETRVAVTTALKDPQKAQPWQPKSHCFPSAGWMCLTTLCCCARLRKEKLAYSVQFWQYVRCIFCENQ